MILVRFYLDVAPPLAQMHGVQYSHGLERVMMDRLAEIPGCVCGLNHRADAEVAMKKINVYLETGEKKTFAGAIDWPGWCRSGGDEESALQALFEYGARYARVVRRLEAGVPGANRKSPPWK